MTTMSKRNNKNTFLSLIIFAVFAFQAANALTPAEIDTICTESQEKQVCDELIRKDPGVTVAANFEAAVSAVIGVTRKQVDLVNGKIGSFRPQLSGPVGTKRLAGCETNYKTASDKFRWAVPPGMPLTVRNFPAAGKLVGEGANAVIACDNAFKTPPPQKSPFAPYNQKIMKLAKIITYLMKKAAAPPPKV